MASVVSWKNFGVLRGVAISLVVLAHCCVPLAGFIRKAALGDRMVLDAVQSMVEVCIPIFVFVSGFFMARFSSTWPTARAGARLVLGRYVLWTVAHYGLYLAAGVRLNLWTTLWYGMTGGDRGHWFLVLLVQLYVLTPLVVPWTRSHPRRAVAAAILLQLIHSGIYYLRFAGLETLVHRELVFLQLPFFILGILASSRSEQISSALVPRRRALAIATVAAFALLLGEQAFLQRAFPDEYFFPETLSVMIAGAFAVLWGFAADSRPTRAREALNWVGLRSLGILLVHPYVLRATVAALWHFERILGLTARPRTEAPLWLFAHAWTIVPLFVASLGVPLLLIEGVERVAGKRNRTLVFG